MDENTQITEAQKRENGKLYFDSMIRFLQTISPDILVHQKRPAMDVDERVGYYLECEKLLTKFFDEVSYCIPNCITKERSLYIPDDQIHIPGRYGCCIDDHWRPDTEAKKILYERQTKLYGVRLKVTGQILTKL